MRRAVQAVALSIRMSPMSAAPATIVPLNRMPTEPAASPIRVGLYAVSAGVVEAPEIFDASPQFACGATGLGVLRLGRPAAARPSARGRFRPDAGGRCRRLAG